MEGRPCIVCGVFMVDNNHKCDERFVNRVDAQMKSESRDYEYERYRSISERLAEAEEMSSMD